MGWRLVAAAFLGMCIVTGVVVFGYGTDEVALGIGLRVTARISLGLFVLTFIASSVNSLWRGSVGRALMRNRKYLGLSFATSHIFHLGFIGGRVFGHSDAFWSERTVTSLIPGGIAYALLLAMIVTSFPGPARALGRRWWKRLHKVGMYVFFVVFTVASVNKLKVNAFYAIHVSALMAALGLRTAARLRQVSRRRTKRAPAEP